MVCQAKSGMSKLCRVYQYKVKITLNHGIEDLTSNLASLAVDYLVKFFSKFFSFLLSSSFLQLISRFLNVIRVVDGNELYVAIGSANNLFALLLMPGLTFLVSRVLVQRRSCYQHAQCMFPSHKNNKNPQLSSPQNINQATSALLHDRALCLVNNCHGVNVKRGLTD